MIHTIFILIKFAEPSSSVFIKFLNLFIQVFFFYLCTPEESSSIPKNLY